MTTKTYPLGRHIVEMLWPDQINFGTALGIKTRPQMAAAIEEAGGLHELAQACHWAYAMLLYQATHEGFDDDDQAAFEQLETCVENLVNLEGG